MQTKPITPQSIDEMMRELKSQNALSQQTSKFAIIQSKTNGA